MAEGGERTAAEREAARLERERRRVGGVFNAPETRAFVDFEQLEDEFRVGEPERAAPDVAQPHRDEPDEPVVAHEPEPLDVERSSDVERPSGTRRVSHQDRHAKRVAASSARRGGRHRRPVAGPATAVGGLRGWFRRGAALVALVLAAALAWFLISLFQPFGSSPHGHVTVVIPHHDSSSQVADLLASDGVVASSFFFELRATLAGERGDLRPGTYHLRLGMSYGAALAALTKAPRASVLKTTELTIADGHTRQYVAKLLRRQGIRGDYLKQTLHSPLLDPHAYGAPRHVPSLEGFLFPDTFSLTDPVTVKALVAEQLRDFKRRFARVNLSYAHAHHLSAYDVLTIASLIEGEAARARDRPLVASVIYNRLRDGMLLGMDSTTRYATGNFTRPLTSSQLRSRSPYNTRTRAGLPPTPIDSPGTAAIEAAAHPAHTDYLYFFAKPCSNQSVFATSFAQFQHLLAVDYRPHCKK